MKWTLGLLLLGAVGGCGYRQTKMVACPETGCPATYASSSPQGLPGPTRMTPAPEPGTVATIPAPPIEPLPDNAPPPPPPIVPTPAPLP